MKLSLLKEAVIHNKSLCRICGSSTQGEWGTKAREVFWQMLTWAGVLFCFFRAVSMLFLILYLFIICMFILFLVVLGLHCWFRSPALAGRFLPTLPPGESLSWALKGKGGEVKERVEWAESVKAGRREIASFWAPIVRATWSPQSLKWVPVFVSPVPYAKIVAKTNVKKLFPYVFLQEFYGIPS